MQMQREPVHSLHSATVEELARWIVGGRYGSGSLLPNEAEIGDELQVSRTVVREAVRTLVAKGMLATRRRLGTEVTPQSNWSLFDREVLGWRMRHNPTSDLIRDLYDFRMTVEIYAVERCAADPAFDRDELMRRLIRLEAAAETSTGEWMEADIAFHRHMLIGSGNQFFVYIEPILDVVFHIMLVREQIDPDVVRKAVPAHRAVAEAVIRGDVAGARRAMEALVRRGSDELADLLDDVREHPPEAPRTVRQVVAGTL
jgi:GntR family transcriptional regulator, galactonate operon transcriptional repressor